MNNVMCKGCSSLLPCLFRFGSARSDVQSDWRGIVVLEVCELCAVGSAQLEGQCLACRTAESRDHGARARSDRENAKISCHGRCVCVCGTGRSNTSELCEVDSTAAAERV